MMTKITNTPVLDTYAITTEELNVSADCHQQGVYRSNNSQADPKMCFC